MESREAQPAVHDVATNPAKRMPLLPITSQETVVMCSSLRLRPSDIFICSYPKSGTTWCQHIILSLLLRERSNSTTGPCPYTHVSDYAPFFEVDRHWDSESRDLAQSIRSNHANLGRRVFNTHLWWEMLPRQKDTSFAEDELSSYRNGRAKLVYLVRSPLDACVSFFNHLSHQVEGGYEGTFDEFFQDWVEGKVAFGSWVDHILSFSRGLHKAGESSDNAAATNGQDLMFLSYEDMISDLPGVVNKLVDFLSIQVTPRQVEELLPSFSFPSMKKDLDKFQPRSVQWKNGFQFLRKGVSGDSKVWVSDRQTKQFRRCLEEVDFIDELNKLLDTSDTCVLRQLLRYSVFDR